MVEVDLERPRGVDAQRREAVARDLAPEVAERGEQRVAGAALAAGAGLQLTHLLERVDDDVAVAPDGEPHAGVAVGERREVAVAEVALGRRAGGDDRPRVRQQRDVALGDVDRVHDGRGLGEERRALEQLDRRAAVLGLALLHLARLLGCVDVADEAVVGGVGGDLAQPVAGTARTLCAATPTVWPASRRASTRARNASTDASRNRGCPPRAYAAGSRTIRSPASRAASATAIAIALGSSCGVPSGRWWT